MARKTLKSKPRTRRSTTELTELVYDESARRDFLTGFHKRKLEQKRKAKERYEQKIKEERRELRKENNKRHLIVSDLERIEAVASKDEAATPETVSTIPSATRVTTVTVSDWNPDEEDDVDVGREKGTEVPSKRASTSKGSVTKPKPKKATKGRKA
ncbi:uncharacterized protein SPPG_02383 [Spizellomyces punctatus DAOM BR117]|uniref:Nucleolar protein 12 n=1 Tax=Spizellomyces punctatus (strain DAOM BR117) TaxID=645134 RepID=A0A0L0HQX2_SPIPD|nr:uncharacterized protein SPPG_02383 [Spizellomyces punctatus DAOM BR117]KND03340.1 hypothetical protein SPPG_02383 [Spizellomyces punctatus DAOM BR117]|eukprot:XP_016611379.1 hypothetical protein SPPG_02383 [Spizellomyces punctatus DAOM BR117]